MAHNAILQKINELRARHGAHPLAEDQHLDQSATNWAKHLAANGGNLAHSGTHGVGENLAMCGSWDQAVDMWYSEVKNINWNHIGFAMNTGHATQLLWKSSTHIGFGEARLHGGESVFVTQFTPPGNVAGNYTQNVSPAGAPAR